MRERAQGEADVFLANCTETGKTKETFEQMTCFDDARERRTGRNGRFPQILDCLLSLGKKCFLTTADTRKQESQFPFETGSGSFTKSSCVQ